MNEWKTVRLGDVATYINGYAFKPSDWGTTGLPIIRIQNLTGNDYETNFFNGEIHPKYTVKDGDVLISWSASLGVYEWNKGKALLNQHIFKVVFDKIEVDKKYFIFTVSHLLNEMVKHTHGSTMRHITKPDFDNMPFPLPSIKEQKKISELLEKCTSIIATNKQMLEKYDTLIKSRFIEMFGDNPIENGKWKVEKLKNICTVTSSKRIYAEEQSSDGVPFLRISDLVAKISGNDTCALYIPESKYQDFKLKGLVPKLGDILVTSRGTLGLCYIINPNDNFYFQDGMITWLSFENHNEILSIFLSYVFNIILKAKIDMETNGATVKYISISEMKQLKIPLPPLSLQTQFAAFVQQIDKSKFAVQKSLEKTETLYKSLMQRYFA